MLLPSAFHGVTEDFEGSVDFLEGLIGSGLFLLCFRGPAVGVPLQSGFLVNLLEFF